VICVDESSDWFVPWEDHGACNDWS
jgi:hypothetical protein